MVEKVKNFFKPPVFEGEEETRKAGILNIILWALIGASVSILITLIAFSEAESIGFYILPVLLVFEFVFLWMMRRGNLTLPSAGLPALILLILNYTMFDGNGIRTNTIIAYFVIVVIAGLLLGRRGIVVFTLLTLASLVGLFFFELGGLIVPDFSEDLNLQTLVIVCVIFGLVSLLLGLLVSSFSKTLDQVRANANTLDEANRELMTIRATLEDQVAARTRNLTFSVGLSQQLVAIQYLDELLCHVVDRVQEEFDLYHTHIYLTDEETGELVMAQGYGEVGKQLKAQSHKLAAGAGIVGTVASTGEHFLSNDVNDLLNFIRNPLLPKTKSELAVPLRKGKQILGVLDVQSEQLNRFSATEVSTLQATANQVAAAIDNLRLLEETQEAVQEVQRLNRRLLHEGWEEVGKELKHNIYRFIGGDRVRIQPATEMEVGVASLKEATIQKKLVTRTVGNGKPAAEISVPLMLRGEVIGVMGIKRETAANWTDKEKDVVQSVANQTALALENARLSQEQERTIVQLQEVDRLKSEFLTSMSHELRTPLNSIIGFADIILQGIDGPLTEHALTDITAIHNSGKHLLNLINDLLDLSKIEAGRMELARVPLSIPDLFSEVAATASSLLTKKPVDLVFDLPDEAPPIWADPLRISQILLNLVSNAIKFTEEGTVTMAAKPIEGNLMQVSVTDTGIGIPEDKFDLVFEHFRQVDSRTNRKFQGTGMGLAIARQLAELHGGRMWLESAAGEGTTFYFSIPIATKEQLAETH
jgi:signal transduction histidine kinase